MEQNLQQNSNIDSWKFQKCNNHYLLNYQQISPKKIIHPFALNFFSLNRHYWILCWNFFRLLDVIILEWNGSFFIVVVFPSVSIFPNISWHIFFSLQPSPLFFNKKFDIIFFFIFLARIYFLLDRMFINSKWKSGKVSNGLWGFSYFSWIFGGIYLGIITG